MMRFATALAALSLAFAGPATAQTLDSRAAKKEVFSPRGRTVQMGDFDWMTPEVRKATEAYAKQFAYYGAFAVSPGDPAETGSAVAVQNHHSVQSAQAAALRGCNARRTTGGPCVVAATILPRGYKPRSFTLSFGATESLRKGFNKLQSPKAFAISPQTGAYGFDRGDGGRALAACNAQTKGAGDCRVVVFDQ